MHEIPSRRSFIGKTSASAAVLGGTLIGVSAGTAGSAVAKPMTATIHPIALTSGKTTKVDSDGVGISVHEYGNPAGRSILFIHGWCQCSLSWYKQFNDRGLASRYRLVAMDIRGHGESDRPSSTMDAAGTSTGYTAVNHANDVARVIAALNLVKPILVAWSFGGLVMMDYLSQKGFSNVGGVVFVDSNLGNSSAPNASNYFGPGILGNFPDLLSDDLNKSTTATLKFLKAVPKSPFGVDDLALAWAYNMATPSGVRSAILARAKDDYETLLLPRLKTAPFKTMVVTGDSDTVILPGAADAISAITGGRKVVYSAGHAPFLEVPAKFNLDLAEFST